MIAHSENLFRNFLSNFWEISRNYLIFEVILVILTDFWINLFFLNDFYSNNTRADEQQSINGCASSNSQSESWTQRHQRMTTKHQRLCEHLLLICTYSHTEKLWQTNIACTAIDSVFTHNCCCRGVNICNTNIFSACCCLVVCQLVCCIIRN